MGIYVTEGAHSQGVGLGSGGHTDVCISHRRCRNSTPQTGGSDGRTVLGAYRSKIKTLEGLVSGVACCSGR